MKKTMLITALVSAFALVAVPASADVGRTVVVAYNFAAFVQGVEEEPWLGEAYVAIRVIDNSGEPVYFRVQQEGNPNVAWGCGTLQYGDVVSDNNHPGTFLYPIVGSGPGGSEATPVVVFPSLGPGPTPDAPCLPGSFDASGGTVTFVFHSN